MTLPYVQLVQIVVAEFHLSQVPFRRSSSARRPSWPRRIASSNRPRPGPPRPASFPRSSSPPGAWRGSGPGYFFKYVAASKPRLITATWNCILTSLGSKLPHQLVVDQHAIDFLELAVVVVKAQLDPGLLRALADLLSSVGGLLVQSASEAVGRQSEGGEHHLLEPEFLGEGDALVEVLLQFAEAVVAALAAQSRAFDRACVSPRPSGRPAGAKSA